ncbi:MAG: hypothetical protein SNJ59_10635 [Aggregatilineales bacterium]
MTSNLVLSPSLVQEVTFAGDEVLLAGQIEYPETPQKSAAYPLLFILHHACCGTRDAYEGYAKLALQQGCAAFRWDKRGCGRSGGGGRGSTTQDAVNAYACAVEQPFIDRERVVVLAIGAGTGLFGSAFDAFAQVQAPRAALLISNMLDETAIVAIKTPVYVLASADDWNPPERYAVAAVRAHRAAHQLESTYHIIDGVTRMLETADGALSLDAQKVIAGWLSRI